MYQKSLLKHCQNFFKDQQGGIAIITGLAILPLAILMGVTLDLARYSYLITRLTAAANSAALAGERYQGISRQGMATSFFNANYPAAMFGVTSGVTITASSTSDSTIVTVAGSLPTLFSKIVGISSIPFTIKTQATGIPLGQNGTTIPSNLGYDSPYLSIFPEGSHQSQATVDNLRAPALILQQSYPVTATFAYSNAAYSSTVGYYTIASDGTIQNPKIIFPDAQPTTTGGPLTFGSSTVTLGTFPAGTQFGLFMISGGYNVNNFTNSAAPNYINTSSGTLVFAVPNVANPTSYSQVTMGNINSSTAPNLYYIPTSGNYFQVNSIQGGNAGIFHSAASASNNTLNLNASKLQQVVAYGNVSGIVRFGFEDYNLLTQTFGDADYNDVVIDVNLGPLTTDILLNNTGIILSDPAGQY